MPEIKGNYIHLPVRKCNITSTITISEKDGIKALYCGNDKKIATYLFDKSKWNIEKAREWVNKHKYEEEVNIQLEEFEKWWKSYVESENDLDDDDFAWLSDEYKKMSKSEKEKCNKAEHRKLPYKIHGVVNESGWKAAWAAIHGARGGVDLRGGSSKEEVIKKLLRDKPEGVKVKEEHETNEYSATKPSAPDIFKMPIMTVGKHTSSNGIVREFTLDDLKRIAEVNNKLFSEGKECPFVISHCNNTEALKNGLLLGYCRNYYVGKNQQGQDTLFADCDLLEDKKALVKSGAIKPLSGTFIGDRLYQVAAVGDQAVSSANLKYAIFNYGEEGKYEMIDLNISENKEKAENKEKTISFEEYEKIQKRVNELELENKKTKIGIAIDNYKEKGNILPAQSEILEKLFLSFNSEQEDLMKQFLELNKMVDFSNNEEVIKLLKEHEQNKEIQLSDSELAGIRAGARRK